MDHLDPRRLCPYMLRLLPVSLKAQIPHRFPLVERKLGAMLACNGIMTNHGCIWLDLVIEAKYVLNMEVALYQMCPMLNH